MAGAWLSESHVVEFGFQHMGDSEDYLEAELGPVGGNPFPPLTDSWAIHDSVLGILRLFGTPQKNKYTPEEAQAFRYHFDFIGAVLDIDVMEVLEVFNEAAMASVRHPLQITYMLCEPDY